MIPTEGPENNKSNEFILNKESIIEFSTSNRTEGQGQFFIISGSSGVGKNTLLNYALERVKDVHYLPSITTRQPRVGETQGKPYYFVDTQHFKKMIDKGSFLEWKKIHNGNYYGTHLPTISYALKNGYSIATDMDVLGFKDAKKRFPNNIISIFVLPPSLEELKSRLLLRDNNISLVNTRLERVALEIKHKQHYDFVIINDSLEKAGRELVLIMKNQLKGNAK